MNHCDVVPAECAGARGIGHDGADDLVLTAGARELSDQGRTKIVRRQSCTWGL